MSDPSILPIRQNLRDFFRDCERVLATVHAPDHALFSHDELQMICYYANEVAKMADAQRLAEHRNGKPALT